MSITVKKADDELKAKCKRFVRVLHSPSVASLATLPHQGASICIPSPSEAPVQFSVHDNQHLIQNLASKLTRKHPPPRAFQLADVGMRGLYLSLDILPGLPPSRCQPGGPKGVCSGGCLLFQPLVYSTLDMTHTPCALNDRMRTRLSLRAR